MIEDRLTELTKQIEEMGANHAGWIPVEKITFDPYFREMCKANACGNYGKCWMCPPDVGDIHELIQEAKQFQYAIVYQTIGTLEDSYDFEGMMEAGGRHNQLARKIFDAFSQMPFSRKLHLGAGGCRVCPVCAKRENKPCRHPELAMASLETYGVNVSELAASCGMKYINGPDTVTYFGAVLLTE